jgi:hypothetical protein
MAYKIIDNDRVRCQAWVASISGTVGAEMTETIGLEKDGELVCVVGYNCFNGKSCQQHIYSDGIAKYAPRNFIWFIYYYPFIQLGLDLLIGIFPEDNANIIRLASHAGFEEKYRIDGGHPDGDLILCTMKKSDCKLLNIKIKV